MKQVSWGASETKVPAVVLGCMRLEALNAAQAAAHIEKAVSLGVNFFDHADIYGQGRCESLFADALAQTELKREDLWIQSKCGIVSGVCYNFDKNHILTAAEGILKRLNVEYLDSLLLHRPDALMEPEEVAAAFDQLYAQGKVRHFGVSNHNPGQIKLLKKYVDQPIEANQLQFGLGHAGMVSRGMEVNVHSDGAASRDGGILDYCRLEDITIQTWSPFQYGMFRGVFFGVPQYEKLNKELEVLGAEYGVSPTTMASAWILRHPAGMQLIAGTMKGSRLEEIAKAAEVKLSREHWYRLYLAAGYDMP